MKDNLNNSKQSLLSNPISKVPSPSTLRSPTTLEEVRVEEIFSNQQDSQLKHSPSASQVGHHQIGTTDGALLQNTALPGAIFNLTKSAIGVGTLFLAYSISKMGLLLGLFMLALASITCIGTLHFLAKAASNSGMIGNYFSMGKLALGRWGEVSALACLAIYLIGGLIAYSQIVGQYLSSSLHFFIFGSSKLTINDSIPWYLSSKFLTIISGAVLIFPLSCLREMRLLARTSLAGLVCMFYITVLTIVDFFLDEKSPSNQIVLVKFSMEFFAAFSTILFAYTNQFTMVALVPVLKDPSPKRFTLLNIISSGIVFVVYALVGGFGYGHFGDGIKGNILTAPSIVTWPYAIAQFAVGLVIICSYPLLADPARSAFEQMLSIAMGKRTTSTWWARLAWSRHFIITGLLVTLSTVIAITFAKQVLLILGVFTALCGSLLMYVFPSIYFLKLAPNRFAIAKWERLVGWFNIVFGLVVMVLGTYSGIDAMVQQFRQQL